MTTYPVITDASKSDLSLLARAIVVLDAQLVKNGLAKKQYTTASSVLADIVAFDHMQIEARYNSIKQLPFEARAQSVNAWSSPLADFLFLEEGEAQLVYRVEESTGTAYQSLMDNALSDTVQSKQPLLGTNQYASENIPTGDDMTALDAALVSHDTRLKALEGK